jgi:ribosomal protein L37AE/L43A
LTCVIIFIIIMIKQGNKNLGKEDNKMECPGCSNKRGNKRVEGLVFTCAKCGAIFGQTYLGDSYKYVKPYMTAEAVPIERTRYYDFDCLSSKGLIRRHGWYDTESGLITQIG